MVQLYQEYIVSHFYSSISLLFSPQQFLDVDFVVCNIHMILIMYIELSVGPFYSFCTKTNHRACRYTIIDSCSL